MNAELVRRGNGTIFSPMRRLMNEMLGETLVEPAVVIDETFLPVDVVEDEKTIRVTASLPGFKPSEVNAEVKNGILSINAQKTEEKEERSGKERWYRKERKVSSLTRQLTLPAEVVETQATAELKDGVLTLTLPKAEPPPAGKPKKIPIK